MTKSYNVEVQFSKKTWYTTERFPTQTAALDYVRTQSLTTTFPIRVVRVVRTIIFEDKK